MLYRTGYQKGVSVGFKPLRYEERRDEKTGAFLGIRFLEQELLETSAVPVPANRNVLRRALDQAPVVGEYLRLVDAIGNAAEAPSSNINRAAVCVHEGIWPELAARVDDISKLIGELAQMLEEADQFGEPGGSHGETGPGAIADSASPRLENQRDEIPGSVPGPGAKAKNQHSWRLI